jgi:hypothetical protein
MDTIEIITPFIWIFALVAGFLVGKTIKGIK